MIICNDAICTILQYANLDSQYKITNALYFCFDNISSAIRISRRFIKKLISKRKYYILRRICANCNAKIGAMIMEIACLYGKLAIIIFLDNKFGTKRMLSAATYKHIVCGGHLCVIKYFAKDRNVIKLFREACFAQINKLISKEHFDVVAFLMQNNYKINAKVIQGAHYSKNMRILRHVETMRGAIINYRDIWECAVSNGDIEIAKYVQNKHKNAVNYDMIGDYECHAAATGNLQMLQYLISIDKKPLSNSILQHAIERGHVNVATYLFNNFKFHYNFHIEFDIACINGHLEMAKILMQRASISQKNDIFHTINANIGYIFTDNCTNNYNNRRTFWRNGSEK